MMKKLIKYFLILIFLIFILSFWGVSVDPIWLSNIKCSFEQNTISFFDFIIDTGNSISLVFAVLILCCLFKSEISTLIKSISQKISEIKVLRINQWQLETLEKVEKEAEKIPHKTIKINNRQPIDRFMHSWINFEKIFMKGLNQFNIRTALYERYKSGLFVKDEYEFLLFILRTRNQVFHGENIFISDEVYLQMSDFLDSLSIILEYKWKNEDQKRKISKK